ncbi:MAG: multicopper oxidase domain-containing protein [Nitrospinae bacterium]|nr:multicopper oxidase domain-containing protein [Nitrospinota bacterium]
MKKILFVIVAMIMVFATRSAAYAADQKVAAAPGNEKAILGVAPMAAPAVKRTAPAHVVVELETIEKVGQLKHPLADQPMGYQFWTFNGTVPGPMIRVRVGDTVELHLTNNKASKNTHSIDLHAVWGQGGGANYTQTPAGGDTAIEFKATTPGAFIYHCATTDIPMHIANGMYGMIVVDPETPLPKVDHEYYIMQGEYYPAGKRGEANTKKVSLYSKTKALDERPEYVLFNAMSDGGKLEAKTGETVRLYVGNGGPNLTSAFHVIGAIFDKVYPEGALSDPHSNVQTTVIPPGGAAVVDMKIRTAANYILVDHAINRAISKGGVAILAVAGEDKPEIYKGLKKGGPGGH